MQLTIKKLDSLGLKKQALDKVVFNDFKTSLKELQLAIKKGVAEKTVEMPLQNFLRDSFYRNFTVNKKNDIDLAIFDGKTTESQPAVIFEIKRPDGNKTEMMSLEKPNAKALHELVLYYFQELKSNNTSIQHLIVTDLIHWFVFDEKTFSNFFRKNTAVKKQFDNWSKKKQTTDIFYADLKNLLDNSNETIDCLYFNLNEVKTDKALQTLCRFFTPAHLLNISANSDDSNSINVPFYNELLHILGLREGKNEKGNLIIKRLPQKERHIGSLLELTIERLESTDTFGELKNKDLFGDNREEQIESVALELCITWLNRILFLKLLEAQVIQHNKNRKRKIHTEEENTNVLFLKNTTIKNFDSLYDMFFKVLAKRVDERQPHIQKEFGDIPYLNSSLFEIQKDSLERQLFSIDGLSPNRKLPYFKATCLLDENQKRRIDGDLTLRYLLDFLSSYNFGVNTDADNMQSKSDSMVNASVLGKIFEKLNGYKDGAIFTPAFVTMHITRQALRHIAIQKVRDTEGVSLETFGELKSYCRRFYKSTDTLKLNAVLNSIRLCDPSVGSGHFLVSALNEMIAMKSELGILADEKGDILRCRVEVKGDELHIFRHGYSELFVYTPDDPESQQIQETLFREKQTIIENCLFGVDINPKSIAICRLRLWIELLKNTFYTPQSNFTELETLPNLDINIFTGDSLVGRYKIKSDGNAVKNAVETFKKRRHDYFKERNSETKREIRAQIDELKNRIGKNFTDNNVFWNTDIQDIKTKLFRDYQINVDGEKLVQSALMFGDEVENTDLLEKRQRKIDALLKKLEKLKQERDDYERLCRKAFEWRFQIPDVLSDNAVFQGFDIIVGNPPYIPQEELSPAFKMFADKFFRSGSGFSDMLVYFIELSFSLLRPSGVFSMIVSNKFMRAGYGKKLRQFLADYRPLSIIDFGDLPVFKEATAYPAIIAFENSEIKTALAEDIRMGKEISENIEFQCLNPKDLSFDGLTLYEYFEKNSTTLNSNSLALDGWNLTNQKEQLLLAKIKKVGQTLGEYVTVRKEGKKQGEFVFAEQTFRGILTGLNEAFVIDAFTKNRLIAEDAKAAEVIKPFLVGRDIKRYQVLQADKYLIGFKKGKTKADNLENQDAEIWFQKKYPSVYNWLLPFKTKAKVRTDKGDYWWELRACDYYEEFDKPKIYFPGMSSDITAFTFDVEGIYGNDNTHVVLSDEKYLLGVLNSRVSHFFLSRICDFVSGGFARLKIAYVKQIPIPEATEAQKIEVAALVEIILKKKRADAQTDTTAEETAINAVMYQLFGIEDAEEIALIEGK